MASQNLQKVWEKLSFRKRNSKVFLQKSSVTESKIPKGSLCSQKPLLLPKIKWGLRFGRKRLHCT